MKHFIRIDTYIYSACAFINASSLTPSHSVLSNEAEIVFFFPLKLSVSDYVKQLAWWLARSG